METTAQLVLDNLAARAVAFNCAGRSCALDPILDTAQFPPQFLRRHGQCFQADELGFRHT